MVLPRSFTDSLAREFAADFFSTDADDLATYGRDWTKVFTANAAGVARPRSTEEVAKFLALCAREKIAVVPSGGRTGLAGGAMATNGEVVLSLVRMNQMSAIDALGGTVRVGAGAVTQAVHEHVAKDGWMWPVDFASKGQSQVGGNIATNAGGVRVIRYGLVRQWVLGLRVVLADGRILELNHALEKNNTGTDLRQLFIGSEGTLGVVTEATLKLVRPPEKVAVYLFALSGLAQVLALFRNVRAQSAPLAAFEFFTDRCLARLLSHRKLREPFLQRHSHYVLLEVEGEADEAWLASLFEKSLVTDGVAAQSSQQAQELWALREGISESLSATGLPHKNDIALPIAALENFTHDLEALLAKKYANYELCLFGHIGDGNLHVNIMKPEALAKEAFFAETHALDDDMFALVRQHEGSISAEHGIGLLKRDFLHYTRTKEEIAALRAVKAAFDPLNILNPGKIFSA